MHEHSFPESSESPDERSARAVDALQYEEQARLGFRRRASGGVGDPYAKPDQYEVGRDVGLGELWGGFLGGFAVILGVGALVYKPLVLSFIAALFGIGAVIAGGDAAKIGRIALIVACFGFFFGMLLAILLERSVL
jgi:hypothetical protein